jgi:hypothetical protein
MLKVSGGDNPYTVDTGEFQVALAEWGTVHHTGYPLYMLIGSPFVFALWAVGVPPATGASLYSLVWGAVAVAGVALLAWRLCWRFDRRAWLSIALALVVALGRTNWIHGSIAEVYSLSLAITVAILWVTLNLMDRWDDRQGWLLAFLFGLGVAHHRLIGVALPAVALNLYPGPWLAPLGPTGHTRIGLRHERRRSAAPAGQVRGGPGVTPDPPAGRPAERGERQQAWAVRAIRWLPIALLCVALGFLPYLDMPLRVRSGANWVYGRPDTWDGFWFLFFGSEVEGLQRPVTEIARLLANTWDVVAVLARELTWPGLIACLIGAGLALYNRRTRRPALLLVAVTLCYAAFAIIFREAVLLEADLITPGVCLVLCLGLGTTAGERGSVRFAPGGGEQGSVAVWGSDSAGVQGSGGAGKVMHYASRITHYALRFTFYALRFTPFILLPALFFLHRPFVLSISRDPSGVAYIEQVSRLEAPPGAVVMAPWGWRYFALAYAQRIEERFADWNIVDHRADFAALAGEAGQAYTSADSFYIFTAADFWGPRLGGAHLSSAGPGMVRISARPEMRRPDQPVVPLGDGLALVSVEVRPPDDNGATQIVVTWTATATPAQDYSTFVHVSDQEQIVSPDDLIGQSDQVAPVYAWYATRRWTPGEVVREDHLLALPADRPARLIVVGMYRRDEAGNFLELGCVEVRRSGENWVITR